MIYEVLDREASRRSIAIGGYDHYLDSKIRIVAFLKKAQAVDWCARQYQQSMIDACGLGHSLHIPCFW